MGLARTIWGRVESSEFVQECVEDGVDRAS